MKMKRQVLLSSALVALSVAATAGTAQAGGFAVREQSIYGLGTSFAGIAAPGASPSSIFWNPAAVTNNGGGILTESNATFIVPHSRVDVISATAPTVANVPGVGPAPLTPAGPLTPFIGAGVTAFTGAPTVFGGQDLGADGTSDIGLDAFIPSSYSSVNLGYFGLDDRISVGLSTGAPFGLVTKNDYGSSARFHGRTSELRVINAAPTVGFEFNEMVSFGVGLQVSYADVRLTQASVLPRSLAPLPVIAGIQADTEFEGDDIAFGFTAGVSFKPNDATTLGLGFRSHVSHRLDGTADIVGPSAVVARALGGIEADLELPEVVTFGYRQDITDRFTLLAGIEWANWSRFDELRVEFDDATLADNVTPQNYEDGWFFSLGAEFAATDTLTLRTGVAYEDSPVQDEFRTPRLPDADRIFASLGATYELTDRFSLDASYAHIFVDDAPINLLAADEPTRGGLQADADSSIDVFGVALRFKLGHAEPVVETDTYYKQ